MGNQSLLRTHFVEPQPLAAQDLTLALAGELRHQALHVRGLHNTWGVAQGLVVQESFGDVFLGPGLAFDAYGRSVLVNQGGIAPLPPTPTSADPPWWFDLALRYQAPTPGAGHGRGRSGRARLDSASWRWCYAGSSAQADLPPLASAVRLGLDIPLARLRLEAEGRVGGFDLTYRRRADRQIRPHLGSGRVQTQVAVAQENPFSAQITIQTANGGFSQTPFYLAALAEHPYLPAARQGRLDWRVFAMVAGPFLNITQATRDHFVLEVRFGVDEGSLAPILRAVQVLPLTVDWLGLEPMHGCSDSEVWR